MNVIAKKDFANVPSLNLEIGDGLHPLHVHKGAEFNIGSAEKLADLNVTDRSTLAELVVTGSVIPTSDEAGVRKIKAELDIDKAREENAKARATAANGAAPVVATADAGRFPDNRPGPPKVVGNQPDDQGNPSGRTADPRDYPDTAQGRADYARASARSPQSSTTDYPDTPQGRADAARDAARGPRLSPSGDPYPNTPQGRADAQRDALARGVAEPKAVVDAKAKADLKARSDAAR